MRALIGTYIITCIYIYIYTVVLSSMAPSFLIGMGALNGTGALINKNTFKGGAYSKGGPQRGQRQQQKAKQQQQQNNLTYGFIATSSPGRFSHRCV